MAYSLSGKFYEACDCEVVCSCWAGVPPDMGVCTGLFAWHIDPMNNGVPGGLVGVEDVSDCRVMLIFNGTSCDQASHAMLLIQAGTKAKQEALENAIKSGPWADVVRLDKAVVMPRAVAAVIESKKLAGNKVSISAQKVGTLPNATDTLAEAFCSFEGFKMQGGPSGNLIRRATGKKTPHSIDVGKIYTDTISGSGLNLLATNADVPPYTFDLDLTDVSAVSGTFKYVL